MTVQKVLDDTYQIADLHFKFLHLGYFYSQLSKRVNFSRIAPSINIEAGQGKGYRLKGKLIREMLEDIYAKPETITFFEYLTLLNSLRGIVTAVREAVRDEYFQEYFKKVFPEENREESYLHFEGVLRFIRNVLTHNINTEIILTERDFKETQGWWDKREKGPIAFSYDYSSPASPIHIPKEEYTDKAIVEVMIQIEWRRIKPGKTRYFDVISPLQNLLFLEFCYNALHFLRGSLSTP